MTEKEYGCNKHKLSFDDFWEKTNELIENDNLCPICIKEKLSSYRNKLKEYEERFVLEYNPKQKFPFHVQPIKDRNKFDNNEEWSIIFEGSCNECLDEMNKKLRKMEDR